MNLTGLCRNPVEEGSLFHILTVKGGGGLGNGQLTIPWYGGRVRTEADGPLTLAASEKAKGCPIHQWEGNFSQSAIRSHV